MKCVPAHRCGTEAPGWLKGSLPKTKKEGAVNRTVCFNWKHECCRWKTQIKVRNCGDFYLFFLKRKNPLDGKYKYRYCGNAGGNAEAANSSSNITLHPYYPHLPGPPKKKTLRNIAKATFFRSDDALNEFSNVFLIQVTYFRLSQPSLLHQKVRNCFDETRFKGTVSLPIHSFSA